MFYSSCFSLFAKSVLRSFMVNVRAGETAVNGWKVTVGSVDVLSVSVSFARTSRSRRFGVPRKATTGTSLKMFLERSVECRTGCFLLSMS